MAFIGQIPIESSTGKVRKLYEDDLQTLGYVANSTKVFALRPTIHASWLTLLDSIRASMPPRRYELAVLAVEAQLRRDALKPGSEVSRGELGAHARDHRYDPLSTADVAVMTFAARVTAGAQGTDRQAIDTLRAQGLSDDEILDIGLAAFARCFWSRALDAAGREPDERSMTLDEGFRRALAPARPIDITEVSRALPARQEQRKPRRADYRPLRRKAIAAGLVVVGLSVIAVAGTRRAVREHWATPNASMTGPSQPAPAPTATGALPGQPEPSPPTEAATVIPPESPGVASAPAVVPNQPVTPATIDGPPREPTPPDVTVKGLGANAGAVASKVTSRPRDDGEEPKGDAVWRRLREFLKSVTPEDLGGEK